MNHAKLTIHLCRAHKAPMRAVRVRPARTGMLLLGALGLAGCITVNAPEEPIVIELNINITQEVIYRLSEDAGSAIDENADIF